MIFETILIANVSYLATKSINIKVIDHHDTYMKIVNDGLYHITSRDNANSIINDGILNPSNTIGDKKIFFFAGKPSFKNILHNLTFSLTEETLYAIKIKPTYEEMAKLKVRIYNDKSISYVGKYQVDSKDTSIVELVYDIDYKNNIIVREKTKEEYVSYTQPGNVKKRIILKNKTLTVLRGMGISYIEEFKSFGILLAKGGINLIASIQENEYENQIEVKKTK